MTFTRRCRECGCTDTQACPGGCFWVDNDLCSRCHDDAQSAPPPAISIEQLKNDAVRIKKAEGIQHARALDKAAQNAGFFDYAHARQRLATAVSR